MSINSVFSEIVGIAESEQFGKLTSEENVEKNSIIKIARLLPYEENRRASKDILTCSKPRK